MERDQGNQVVKLVAPISGATVLGQKSKVEFKTFKLYTPAEAEGSNDIWLANISFTPETLETGMFLVNQLITLGVLGSVVSSEEETKRVAPSVSKMANVFAGLGK